MLVIVVKDFETVVAAVTQAVQLIDQRCQILAVHALARKHPEMPCRGNALFDRLDLCPHEVSQLHQKNLVHIQQIQLIQCSLGGEHVKRIKTQAQVGHVGLANDVPGLWKLIDHTPPGERLVGDLDVHWNGQHGELAQILDQRSCVTGGVHRSR